MIDWSIRRTSCSCLLFTTNPVFLWKCLSAQYVHLRTCMKTECVISGITGGLMDPNYCYKISWSLSRLIIKLAGQTYKSAFFSVVEDISVYHIVSLCSSYKREQRAQGTDWSPPSISLEGKKKIWKILSSCFAKGNLNCFVMYFALAQITLSLDDFDVAVGHLLSTLTGIKLKEHI